jgi:hypothetical protein
MKIISKFKNLFRREPLKKYSTCRFCQNRDTQELRQFGPYLRGSKGSKAQKWEDDQIDLEGFYKGEEYLAFSCFCCGAFWHQSKMKPHWFWTRWNKFKFHAKSVSKKQ